MSASPSSLSTTALTILRVLLVVLPPSILSTFPISQSFDILHYVLVELSVIALFRTLLGLPDPARVLGLTSSVSTTPPSSAPISIAPLSTLPPKQLTEPPLNTNTQLDNITSVSNLSNQPDPIHDELTSSIAQPHPLLNQVDPLVDRFLSSIKMDDAAADAHNWELIVDRGDAVKVWQSRHCQHRFRLLGVFDAPFYTTFDFLNDIESRPSWDDMTDATRILEVLSPTTRIQQIQLKAIWPTSARDLCLLSHCRRLSDTQIITCNMSVQHTLAPLVSNSIRMDTECAGQLCERVVVNGVEKTRVLQVADGDPKGWLPKSILTFVSTKALPNTFIKINQLVSQLPPTYKSQFLPDPGNVPNVFNCTPRIKDTILPPTNRSQPLLSSSTSLSIVSNSKTSTTPNNMSSTTTTTTTSMGTTSLPSNAFGQIRLPTWWPRGILSIIHRVVNTISPYAVTVMMTMMLIQRMRGSGIGSVLTWAVRQLGGGTIGNGPK